MGFILYLCAGALFALGQLGLACAQGLTQACSQIRDNAERLACYDRQFGSPHAPPKSASSDPGIGDSPAGQAKKDFAFSAAVTAIELRDDGKFVATLANGQMWAQTELNSRIEVRVGDTVRIRRGALGSYLLSNDAGMATRVRRVR